MLFLEYEAYPRMAELEMERIATEAIERFGVTRWRSFTASAGVEIGEASVVIAVAAPIGRRPWTRRYVIDTLKTSVPIWKREQFEGGAAWVEGGA